MKRKLPYGDITLLPFIVFYPLIPLAIILYFLKIVVSKSNNIKAYIFIRLNISDYILINSKTKQWQYIKKAKISPKHEFIQLKNTVIEKNGILNKCMLLLAIDDIYNAAVNFNTNISSAYRLVWTFEMLGKSIGSTSTVDV